jgi:RNA polymerase sigma factor (TIGR02999 family)
VFQPTVPMMNDVTRILSAAGKGDPHAAEQLLPLVYDQLRQLAAQKLAQEKPGQTLNATALVHEAYLRLVANQPGAHATDSWNSRGHFFAAAAEAMRRILVENARRKSRLKHGAGRKPVSLESVDCPVDLPVDDMLLLDEALTRLAECDAQAAQLVKLHCFGGLTVEQAAEALGISARTAYRDWSFAQAWLYREIRGSEPVPGS